MFKFSVRALLASLAVVGTLACGISTSAAEEQAASVEDATFVDNEVSIASCRGGEGFPTSQSAAAFCHGIFNSTPGPNRGKGLIKIIPVVSGPARGVVQFNVECCN
jgi:hypothetical protein